MAEARTEESRASTPRPRRLSPSGVLKLQLVAMACLVVALAGIFAAFMTRSNLESVSGPRATVGAAAPAFTTQDLQGRRVSLSDFKGHPLLLNFWATWCTACQDEMPAIEGAVVRHGDQRLQVLEVDYRERDTHAMSAYLQGLHVQLRAALDPDGTIAAAYGVSIGLPVSVFVDANGVVRAIHIGAMNTATIEEEVSKVLR